MPTLAHTRVTAAGATPERWLLVLHGIYGSGRNWGSIARRLVDARPEWGVLLVDLRLLGFLDTERPFTRVFREILHWTWVAFAVAVVTGVLLFMPNARTYVVNTAFGLKMASLLVAGLNMSVFQFTTLKTVARWDRHAPVPLGGRIAGGLSILTWTCVIIFGRLIGFTKGYDYSVPEDIDFDFQSCLECVGALFQL